MTVTELNEPTVSLIPLVPMPRLDGHFHHCQQNAERCQKSLGWRSAGIGYDRQPRSARAGLLGQQFRHVEQFCDRVHAQYAAASKRGINDRLV